ncbi:hypothetical protein [Streptomyces sp. GC420]|uniref:hypothetical protein n=1 Tax=Streptomyces sp. GC420 TaxID=2697568 RepID=UPI0028BE9DFA|nr:hypothetical protein [Streptomyces sp. GC420]
MNPAALSLIDAGELARRLPMPLAIRAVEQALRAGLDPEADIPRTVLDVDAGQLLLMPSTTASYTGVKIAGVAPRNPARGQPRIIASYLLMDAAAGYGAWAPPAVAGGVRGPRSTAVVVRGLPARLRPYPSGRVVRGPASRDRTTDRIRVAAPGLSTPGTSAPKTVRGVRLSGFNPAQPTGTVPRGLSGTCDPATGLASGRLSITMRVTGLTDG